MQKNSDNHDARSLHFDIKINDEKFQISLFIKEIHILLLLSECQLSQAMYHLA